MSKKMSKMFFDFGNYQSLPRVAVIEFKGTIGADASSDMSFSNMKPYIDSAFSQQNLEAVILKINCPGGSPVQCELISTYIKSRMEATQLLLLLRKWPRVVDTGLLVPDLRFMLPEVRLLAVLESSCRVWDLTKYSRRSASNQGFSRVVQIKP